MLDLKENRILGVCQVAEYESWVKISKFKMVDPICLPKVEMVGKESEVRIEKFIMERKW